jgi:TldD protein
LGKEAFALKYAEDLGVEHAEIRYQTLERTAINLREKSLETVFEGTDKGIGIRVIVDGCRGFSYNTNLNDNEIEDAVRRAIKVANIQDGKGELKQADTKLARGKYTFPYKIDPRSVDLNEKITFLKQGIENASEKAGNNLKEIEIGYWDLVYNTKFLSSDGGDATQTGARFYFQFGVTGSTPSGIFYDTERFGMMTGIENLESSIMEVSNRMAERVKNQLKAEKPPIGPTTAIMHSRSAGDFFHEIGHSFEGDSVEGHSAFEGLRGQRVANENLTVYEDPTIKNAWGSYFFDEEGVEPRKVVLIDQGIYKQFLHSRETALQLGETPNGHARAESFYYEPIVRMGNTCVKPGNWKEDELIAETKEGVYIAGARGGSTSGKGPFGFTASEAYQIKNGELVKPLMSVNVSAYILEAISNVDAICEKANYYTTLCGKGSQSMAATGFVPTLRINNVILGG